MFYLVFIVIFAIVFTAISLGYEDVLFPNHDDELDPPIVMLTNIAALVWPLSLIVIIGIGLSRLIKKARKK